MCKGHWKRESDLLMLLAEALWKAHSYLDKYSEYWASCHFHQNKQNWGGTDSPGVCLVDCLWIVCCKMERAMFDGTVDIHDLVPEWQESP